MPDHGMALTNAKMLADQARVFVDFPTESITISGTTYECLVMEQDKGNDYGIGGSVDTITLRVAIERSTMTTIPEQGTLATFSGSSVRIGSVDQSDLASSIVLTLENVTLG